MCWDFKFTLKNQNLPKCRIVAEFFYETPIRAFFRGFQTNCTTRPIRGQSGPFRGLDKVFENRDRHHRVRRQILRRNEGLIFLLAQS